MIFWIVNCCMASLLCIFFAGIVIPQILLIAFRKQLFDLPDERKIHHYRVQAGSVFHHSLVTGNQYGTGTFGNAVRNRERRAAFGFCFLLHHGTVSGWHGR